MALENVPAPVPSTRDVRIDFLRGVALLTIFIDHVPGNFLGTLTLRNFGFADAAELFVLLAGVSSGLAYGREFDRAGAGHALRRVAARCLRIYLYQVGLLLATLAILKNWLPHFGLQPRTIGPLLNGGVRGLGQGLILHALPASLNILPLYIVLLAFFPAIYLGARRHPALTLTVSAGVWAAANLDHDFNLPNWMDGRGWFFNPFAWQLLFAIGVIGSRFVGRNSVPLPYRRWAVIVCALYLGFALVASAPWTNWGLDWKPLDLNPDKTALSPLRLLDILALIYVLMMWEAFRRLVQRPWLGFVAMCGRHSLEVFAALTLLSLMGRLLFRTFGPTWEMQALINGVGFAAMIGVAALLDGGRGHTSRPARKLLRMPNRTNKALRLRL